MAKVKIYRDPNFLTATVHYNHGLVQYKFDINSTVLEVKKEHAVELTRNCEDLSLTKVKKAEKAKKNQEDQESQEGGGE